MVEKSACTTTSGLNGTSSLHGASDLTGTSELPVSSNGAGTSDRVSAEAKLISRIRSVFQENVQINDHADSVQVTVENTAIILSGNLPSADLKRQLIPAIRRAGILWQVCNLVHVPG